MPMMTRPGYADFGKLLLRICVGGLLLFHGIFKVRHGVDFMIPMLQAKNVPEYVRFGVYIGEVVAPVLLILGLLTRLSSLIVIVNLAVAIWLVHLNDLTTIDPMGGSWKMELQAWYILVSLAIFFLGPGRFSIDGLLWKGSTTTPPPEIKTA